MMVINWDIRYRIDSIILSGIQMAADVCLQCEGIPFDCSVDLCLCDDPTIATINQTYRNVASSTDVLSFPTVTYPHDQTAGDNLLLVKREYDDETRTCFLGEIILSVPHLRQQAAEFGHTELREAVYLFVHGICHLMGYDHIRSQDRQKMRAMEERVMSTLSITRDDERINDQTIINLAKDAMQRSYSPYSSFPVGAALLCRDGRVYLGCNIENASLGLTNCAERTAVFKAVSEGAREFDTIAIAAKSKAWPCGACRQVLNEFAPDIRVIVTWDDHKEEKNLRDLLPESFGPGSF